jgi:hypothetical protein
MIAAVLLEFAQLNEELVMLLGGVGHYFLDNKLILGLLGEQRRSVCEFLQGRCAQERIGEVSHFYSLTDNIKVCLYSHINPLTVLGYGR